LGILLNLTRQLRTSMTSRIVEQAAVGPMSDEWIVAHDASLFGSGLDPVVRSMLMHLAL